MDNPVIYFLFSVAFSMIWLMTFEDGQLPVTKARFHALQQGCEEELSFINRAIFFRGLMNGMRQRGLGKENILD